MGKLKACDSPVEGEQFSPTFTHHLRSQGPGRGATLSPASSGYLTMRMCVYMCECV